MMHTDTLRRSIALIVTWAARVGSLASIGLLLLFMVGEGFDPLALSVRQWVQFALFPAGPVVGMLLGWWRPGAGGALTVACLLLFYMVHAVAWGRLPGGPFFVLFCSPGFLFIVAGLIGRFGRQVRRRTT